MIDFVEKLRSELCYDPLTGKFSRRSSGKIVGSVVKKGNGYIRVQIFFNGKTHKAHRLAWVYMAGDSPPPQIDHIDRDATNNAWSNLRDGTMINQRNKSIQRNNKSGFSGVSWNSKSAKWCARAWGIEGGVKVYKSLGLYSCKYSAAEKVAKYRALQGYEGGHGMQPKYEVSNALGS
jgi:hypothetical protein